MPKLSKYRIVGWAIEAAKGTAETLGASDCGEYLFDPSIDPDIEPEDRSPSAFAGGTLPQLMGVHAGGCSLGVELKGSGVDNVTPPKWGELLQMAGFVPTVTASTDVTYARTQDLSAHKTGTIGFWDGQDLKKLAGAAGNFRIEPAGPGKKIMGVFDMRGVWQSPVAQAVPSSITYNTTAPHQFKGITLQRGGSAWCNVSRFRLDAGNDVALRHCVNNAGGLDYAFVNLGVPTLGIDPEDEGVTADDIYGDMLDGTTAALSLVSGTAGGNRVTIAAPRLQRRVPREGDRDGLRTHDIEAVLAATAGADEFTIKFD